MENDAARTLLYRARLYLVAVAKGITVADCDAIQLLARLEMGLCYNVSAPGRGI